jgi:hypothetical protein
MKRVFLTKTARAQRQSIMYFRDQFKLVPIDTLAGMADTFTRNEIMSKNEFRQIVGMKPSSDPKADQLVNSNISQPQSQLVTPEDQTGMELNTETSDKTVESESVSIMDIPFNSLSGKGV